MEEYTLVDSSNLGTGHYTRTIEGDIAYDRTTTGPGATLPSDTDVIDYLFSQTGDPHSGTFDKSLTGTTRYDLLEDFYDISNTEAGRPGHMNFYTFGQPFVDPIVVVLAGPPLITAGEAIAVGVGALVLGWFGWGAGNRIGNAQGPAILMNSDRPARIVELDPGRGMLPGAEVSDEEAAAIVAAGGDIMARNGEHARRIAQMAGDGRAPLWEGAHRQGQNPHYHPTPRTGGHVFYQALAGSSLGTAGGMVGTRATGGAVLLLPRP